MSLLFESQLELHEFEFKVWTSIFNHESQCFTHFANLNSASNVGNLIFIFWPVFWRIWNWDLLWSHDTYEGPQFSSKQLWNATTRRCHVTCRFSVSKWKYQNNNKKISFVLNFCVLLYDSPNLIVYIKVNSSLIDLKSSRSEPGRRKVSCKRR